MRALILRHVGLIDAGASSPVLIGSATGADMVRLQGFLRRNGQPHHLLEPSVDAEGVEVLARYEPTPSDLPLVVRPNGAVLRNPSEVELGRELNMSGGASARIENYLGFPTGISGMALAGRAYNQAQKFGAEMLIPAEAKRLDCTGAFGALAIELADGGRLRSRTVVVASGARYRRPAIPRLEQFEGKGVWYWASPIEAQMTLGQEVTLVGGGNSAGQAAVYLSGFAAKVRMMVRAPGLAESMSRCLIDRIAAAPNIELMTHTEIVALEGSPDTGLQRVRWRDGVSGEESEGEVSHVFLFVGADPATGWLAGCGVTVDKAGFVITGLGGAANLQSPVPGVFAVGDVRSGSVKRVGGATGEGAQVVAAVHAYLAVQAEGKTSR